MSDDDLVKWMAARFAFRARGPFEGAGQYRAALAKYVGERDLSAGHEMRVGRRQVDWTREDTEAFVTATQGSKLPRDTFSPGEAIPLQIINGGTHLITEASLLNLADTGLAAAMRLCQQKKGAYVDASVPIVANVLLTSGQLLVTPVQYRADRVAVLKFMAQQLEVFGYFLVFDGIMHAVDKINGTAKRQDMLMAHVGTRTLRVVKRRPYNVVNGRAVFAPPPDDLVLGDGKWRMDDPYAGIFVSVPTPERAQ